MEKYKVICKSCKGSDILTFADDKGTKLVFFTNHEPIIAARYRPDMNWGFECMCGNDSRVAPQEKNALKVLVRGGEHAIEKIAKSLKPKNENKFILEKV